MARSMVTKFAYRHICAYLHCDQICIFASADVPPFPHLGNGWTDCAEVWYVLSNPLARLFQQVKGESQLHVRTPFRVSETAGRIGMNLVCG